MLYGHLLVLTIAGFRFKHNIIEDEHEDEYHAVQNVPSLFSCTIERTTFHRSEYGRYGWVTIWG